MIINKAEKKSGFNAPIVSQLPPDCETFPRRGCAPAARASLAMHGGMHADVGLQGMLRTAMTDMLLHRETTVDGYSNASILQHVRMISTDTQNTHTHTAKCHPLIFLSPFSGVDVCVRERKTRDVFVRGKVSMCACVCIVYVVHFCVCLAACFMLAVHGALLTPMLVLLSSSQVLWHCVTQLFQDGQASLQVMVMMAS